MDLNIPPPPALLTIKRDIIIGEFELDKRNDEFFLNIFNFSLEKITSFESILYIDNSSFILQNPSRENSKDMFKEYHTRFTTVPFEILLKQQF